MRVPGQLKALLDHWGCYWITHRPDPKLAHKRFLVVTQGIGAPCRGALRDVMNALTWMGVSDIRTLGLKLMEGIVWSEISERRRNSFTSQLHKLAHRAVKDPPIKRCSLKVRLIFGMIRGL